MLYLHTQLSASTHVRRKIFHSEICRRGAPLDPSQVCVGGKRRTDGVIFLWPWWCADAEGVAHQQSALSLFGHALWRNFAVEKQSGEPRMFYAEENCQWNERTLSLITEVACDMPPGLSTFTKALIKVCLRVTSHQRSSSYLITNLADAFPHQSALDGEAYQRESRASHTTQHSALQMFFNESYGPHCWLLHFVASHDVDTSKATRLVITRRNKLDKNSKYECTS